jgi:hypothetical protein
MARNQIVSGSLVFSNTVPIIEELKFHAFLEPAIQFLKIFVGQQSFYWVAGQP